MRNPALTNLAAGCHCHRLSLLRNTSWRSRENDCRDMPDQSGCDQIASSMHSIASYVLLAPRYPRTGKTIDLCKASYNRTSHAMSNIRLFWRQNNLRAGGARGFPYPCRQYPSQSRNPPSQKTTTNQPRVYCRRPCASLQHITHSLRALWVREDPVIVPRIAKEPECDWRAQ